VDSDTHRSPEQLAPRVSAIVTAYNGEPFIRDAIESILAQTRPVDEVVVIDDGSTDGTAAIVERYTEKGVRLVRQQNRGLPEARNRGIQETTGELITFLDCDDIWLPEKTELQIRYLADHPRMGLATGLTWWWEPQSGRRGFWKPALPGPNGARRQLVVHNAVGNASAVMVRRCVLEDVGLFDRSQIWAEDWELWRRVAERWQVGSVDCPLIIYRSTANSLTQQKRWSRIDAYYQFAKTAIIRFRPAYWRPLLFLQAWSLREFARANCVLLEGMPRRKYLWHSTLALVSYPFQLASDKAKQFARAILGEWFFSAYRIARDLCRKAIRRYRRPLNSVQIEP
jgi:glycosyltransferase involved in cell wall biosynthesis